MYMQKSDDQAIQFVTNLLDTWVPIKMQYEEIPALSIAIRQGSRLVYEKDFGTVPKTRYHIASHSKMFTAVAILQLVEKKKLRLDDPVVKYLPWIKGKKQFADAQHITIRHLLSHSSGVFRDGTTLHWVDNNFPNRTQFRKDFPPASALVFEPLEQFKYSNYGFALLGEVIRKVSGTPYDEYIQKNILAVLHLRDTFVDYSKKAEKNLAQGYERVIPGKERAVLPHISANAYASATGFISTVQDMTIFLQALSLQHSGKKQLLSRPMKREMMHAYSDTNDPNNPYGLGLSQYKIGGRTLYGHSGGYAGFYTQSSFDNDTGISVSVMTNTNNFQIFGIHRGIYEALYHFMDNANEYTSGKRIAQLREYQGVYRVWWQDMAVVNINDRRLMTFDVNSFSPGEYNSILIPNGTNTFTLQTKDYFDSPGERIQFKKGKKGMRLYWSPAYYYERL